MGEEAEGGGAGSLGKTGASGQTVCESSGREPASGNNSIEGSVKKDEIDDIWNVDIEENIHLMFPKNDMTGNT